MGPVGRKLLIDIFTHLCIKEVWRQIDFMPAFSEGFKNGYIQCLIDMLGGTTMEQHKIAYENGKTYAFVVDRIILDNLCDVIEDLGRGDQTFSDLQMIANRVSEAVEEHVDEHYGEVAESIMCL